jgi:hypothetical protein
MPERWQHELRKLKTLNPPDSLWDQAKRGPRHPIPRPVRAHRIWPAVAAALAVAAVVAGTYGLAGSFGPHHAAGGQSGRIGNGAHNLPGPRRSAQLTLRMRPVPPLSMSACVAQAEPYGYTAQGAAHICAAGSGQSWYHAVLTNKGAGAYPACRITGFDAFGKAISHRQLYFQFGGGSAGLYAEGHTSTAFSWYLPKPKHGTIVRYVATCSINARPAV